MVSKAVLEHEIEKKFKQIFQVDFKPQKIFGNWNYKTTELLKILDRLDDLELLFKQQKSVADSLRKIQAEEDEELRGNELNSLGALKPY